MRLFYFKKTPTNPCVMELKTWRITFQWKNLFSRRFLLKWKLLKCLWKLKKMGKHIKDDKHLAEELQTYLCLYEKGNKGYKERHRKENTWRTVEKFLIVFLWTIKDQAILWNPVHFSSLLLLKSSLYKVLEMWFSIIDTYLL